VIGTTETGRPPRRGNRPAIPDESKSIYDVGEASGVPAGISEQSAT
jgi:hypothetical protein